MSSENEIKEETISVKKSQIEALIAERDLYKNHFETSVQIVTNILNKFRDENGELSKDKAIKALMPIAKEYIMPSFGKKKDDNEMTLLLDEAIGLSEINKIIALAQNFKKDGNE